jgi:hypothetical protein
MSKDQPNLDNIIRDAPFGHNPRKCPHCGSRNIVPIMYGLPTDEGMKSERRGDVHLGGCVVSGADPEKHCDECGRDW